MTIETEEKTVVHAGQPRRPRFMACQTCRQLVEMASPELAARIAGVSERTIYRSVEAGAVHFMEEGGHLSICIPSLLRQRQAEILGIKGHPEIEVRSHKVNPS